MVGSEGVIVQRGGWDRLVRLALGVLISLATAACGNVVHKVLPSSSAGPKQIAIFIDGTHNDVASDTNVKRLHSLVSLRPGTEIASLYIEGVGVGPDVIGMGTGVGLKRRAVLAYAFLLDEHRAADRHDAHRLDDRIYLFGFSRGAFAARVVASMLYHAGLPTHPTMTNPEIAEVVFDIVKGLSSEPRFSQGRRAGVTAALGQMRMKDLEPVAVEVLGLWDTVEAMGLPNWLDRIGHRLAMRPFRVNVGEPNPRYGDQLCNVRRAYHAVSIDDNREWIFTPLLLNQPHLLRHCGREGQSAAASAPQTAMPHTRDVQEVWFSGGHSDVGGGYADSQLSGVSLNWMISRLSGDRLVPANAGVRADPYGTSHDPESGLFSLVYKAVTRNLGAYPPRDAEGVQRLCVHESVFDRRSRGSLKPHENHLLFLMAPGPVCLLRADDDFSNPPRLQERLLAPGETCAQFGGAAVLVEKTPHCAETHGAR